MVLKIPWSPRIFQNGTLRRPALMRGLPIGMRNGPSRRERAGGSTRAEPSSGRCDARFGTRKSKMRCLPGLQPVWNDVQATGDSARSVVWSGVNVPRSRSRAKFGSRPSARNCSVSSGSWPSRPRTTTRRARAAPRARLPRMRCTTQRIGQVRSVRIASSVVTRMMSSDETKAKPAPGPT